MIIRRSRQRLHQKNPPYFAAGVLMIVMLASIVWISIASFRGQFEPVTKVTVVSSRSGLVMEPGSKVKLHGVAVGRVESVVLERNRSKLTLALDPSKIALIPSNVRAEIKPTTVFGSKYVELTVVGTPARTHLRAGAQIITDDVTTEINTVFENLTNVMAQVEPDKLNSTISAIADGLNGRGAALGQTLSDTDKLLVVLNPELPQLEADLKGTAAAAGTLGDTAPDLMTILRNATATSKSISDRRDDVAAALASAEKLGKTGSGVLGNNRQAVVDTLRLLTPTTALLSKYSPSFTCLLHLGTLDADRLEQDINVNNYGDSVDAGLLWGDDPYKYPDDLPVVAAKGGPHGAPGCYAPVTWDTYPAPYLRMNDGAPMNGPGTDHPRMADPTIADYMFGFTLPESHR